MDYEGYYLTEFDSLEEAEKSVKEHPKGDREDSILVEVIKPRT